MATISAKSTERRKVPVQERSTATVEAIHDATVQVLLRLGVERLTTVRVAERAGVSVGTLYQYFPNKQSLLFAVLERHLGRVTEAVEGACADNHHKPLRTMVESVVEAFVDSKLQHREISMALYRIASSVNAEAIVRKKGQRSRKAITEMLRTAPEMAQVRVDFAASLFHAALAGAIRVVLEEGTPAGMHAELRRHLVLLGHSYLASAAAAAD